MLVMLPLSGAITDFALATDANGVFQGVMRLALVQADLGTTLHVGVQQPISDEERALHVAGPAAHNRIAVKYKTADFPAIMAKLVAEVRSAPEMTHIVSSEMLFTPRLARSLAEHLPSDLIADTRIIGYIRRQGKFLEAMFKQVVKTDRFTGSPAEYMTKRDAALNYNKVLDAYAAEFGPHNINVIPYEPARFAMKNVILDIARRLGLTGISPDDLPQSFSNITLSREISEILGLIARSTDINIAELLRVTIRNSPEGAFHSGDSYSLAERKAIVDRYAEDNEQIRATYCRIWQPCSTPRVLRLIWMPPTCRLPKGCTVCVRHSLRCSKRSASRTNLFAARAERPALATQPRRFSKVLVPLPSATRPISVTSAKTRNAVLCSA